MKHNLHHITLTTIWLLTPVIWAYPRPELNGFEFNVFDSTSQFAFSQEIAEWTLTPSTSGSITTNCGGISMLGGSHTLTDNGIFEKTLGPLPAHNAIFFRIQFAFIDTWSLGDELILKIGNDQFTPGDMSVSTPFFPRDLCGNDVNDLDSLYMIGAAAHTQDSVTIQIYGQFASDAPGSFGIRGLSLIFANYTFTEDSNIQTCTTADIETLSNGCPCPSGLYLDTESTECLGCNQLCSECYGSQATQCIACNEDNHASFVNGECIQCHESCLSCSGPEATDCIKCPLNSWYKWDGTCSETCDSPTYAQQVITDDIKLCKVPCEDGSFYMANNGTCSTECPEPLITFTDGLGSYCNLPCDDPSLFLYLDGTCVSDCGTLAKRQYDAGYIQCTYACNSDEYLYSGSKCGESDLSDEDQKFGKLASSVVKNGMTVLSATSAIGSVLGVNDATVAVMALFMKMMPYLKYMSIQYPRRLQVMVNDITSPMVSFSFGVPISPEISNRFEKYPLPTKFEEYQYHSSFIVNYWSTMTSLLILLGAALILYILIFLFKKNKVANQILLRLQLVFKWNFFLIIFCTNLDGVAIDTSLELRTIHIDSILSVVSLLFCLFINALALISIGLAYYIIMDIRKAKLSEPYRVSKTESKWQDFQLFFKGSKDDNYACHIFIIPYLLRMYIFYTIIAYLFDHPLAQSILIILLNIFILTYMLWKRPFVSKLVLVQHVNDEIITLTVNICLLCLAVLDSYGIEAAENRKALGDAIIYCNLIFTITSNIFLLCYLATGFQAAYRNTKTYNAKGIASWFVALVGLYEAGGMDLEVINHTKSDELTTQNEPIVKSNHKEENFEKNNKTTGNSFFVTNLEEGGGDVSLKLEKRAPSILNPIDLMSSGTNTPKFRLSYLRRTTSYGELSSKMFYFNIPSTPKTELHLYMKDQEESSPIKESSSPNRKLLKISFFPEENKERERENSR